MILLAQTDFQIYRTDNNPESDIGEDEDGTGGVGGGDGLEDDEDENMMEHFYHHQLDNNLPTSNHYSSKTMRLNSECSDPMLLKNCRPGQRWQCINENGRWRKHKCKHNVNRAFSSPIFYYISQ